MLYGTYSQPLETNADREEANRTLERLQRLRGLYGSGLANAFYSALYEIPPLDTWEVHSSDKIAYLPNFKLDEGIVFIDGNTTSGISVGLITPYDLAIVFKPVGESPASLYHSYGNVWKKFLPEYVNAWRTFINCMSRHDDERLFDPVYNTSNVTMGFMLKKGYQEVLTAPPAELSSLWTSFELDDIRSLLMEDDNGLTA